MTEWTSRRNWYWQGAGDGHKEDKAKDKRYGKECDPIWASRGYAKRALEEVKQGRNLALWLRGLTPAKDVEVKPPRPAVTRSVGDGAALGRKEGKRVIFLDGSGTSSDIRLRRCGWGVAWLKDEEEGSGKPEFAAGYFGLSLIHISEPTRLV